MRISSYAVARPAYYDRNTTTVSGTYFAVVGPHAQTTRWTITNPAGKKLYIDAGALSMHRETAPAVSTTAFGALQAPAGNSVINLFFDNAAVGATSNIAMGGSIYVGPGESIIGATYDGSTGGTILYAVFAHGVQFDA